MGNFDFLGDVSKINPFVNQYADVDSYTDTGSYILNALLSGSIYKWLPCNKITALAGEAATGKTFFLIGIIRQLLSDHSDGGDLAGHGHLDRFHFHHPFDRADLLAAGRSGRLGRQRVCHIRHPGHRSGAVDAAVWIAGLHGQGRRAR